MHGDAFVKEKERKEMMMSEEGCGEHQPDGIYMDE